jgi:hypothetical protein
MLQCHRQPATAGATLADASRLTGAPRAWAQPAATAARRRLIVFHGCAVHTGRLGTAMRCNALLALQLAVGLASGRAAVAAAEKPPSFVFMMLDDVGWADFGFMNSSFTTVKSPNIDAWAQAPTSMLLKDMHSGGTVCRQVQHPNHPHHHQPAPQPTGVSCLILSIDLTGGCMYCSPTRASLLTGRNSWRDCVHGVYGPGDPTEGPSMNNGALGDHNDTFAPQFTFSVADAIHAADPSLGYEDGTFIAGKWCGLVVCPGAPSKPLVSFHVSVHPVVKQYLLVQAPRRLLQGARGARYPSDARL